MIPRVGDGKEQKLGVAVKGSKKEACGTEMVLYRECCWGHANLHM